MGIHQQVTTTRNELENAESRIDVQEGKISLVVEEKNGQNVVKAASIVAGINAQTGSYLKLEADKIDLSGYVTATELDATNSTITKLVTGQTTATNIRASQAHLGSSGSSSVYIYGQLVRIYTVTDTNGTNRYVFGYA